MTDKPLQLSQEAMELQGEYTFVRELGRGGTGVVYLAVDRELGREVAIKLVQSPLRQDGDTVRRFIREARTAALLHHPNIVGVHAVKRLEGGAFAMVMQYASGGTLKDLIRENHPLPFGTVESVVRDVAAALVYAHDRGIVHRDVKPENVFLDPATGSALLADFGIARTTDSGDLAQTGIAVGTPSYMAPEQIDSAAVDGRADLYSLGMVMWEMLTGEVPWAGETLYGIILKHKTEKLPSVRHFRPDIPVHLWAVLERLQAKEAADRYPSARALLDALNGARRASLWQRWMTERQLRRTVEPAPAIASVVSAVADAPEPEPVDVRQKTVRFRRVEPVRVQPAPPVDALETAPVVPAPAPVPGSPAPSSALRRAAAVAALVLVTGAGATLYAVNRDAAPADGSGGRIAALLPVTSAPASVIDLPALDPWGPAPGPFTPEAVAAPAEEAVDSAAASPEEPTPPAPEPLATVEAVAAAEAEPPPAPPAPPAPRTVAMAVGGMHSCALSSSGEVVCWGGNASGQVGNGGTGRVAAPAAVGARAAFRDLAAGVSHTCGTSTAGEAFCWGANQHGQLGDGTVASHTAPVRVAGNRRFVTVRAGRSHTCGVTRGGEVFCWGANDAGQLGEGSARPRSTPVRVPGTAFTSVAVGWSHSCAVDRSGRVHCWGANAEGQLGAQTADASPVPVPVAAPARFRQVAAGAAHTCALETGGAVRCWGRNGHGQLGDGTTATRAEPTPVATDIRFSAITAGSLHTCGLTAAGEAFCWGQNNYGQLGDGSTSDRAVPRPVHGGARFASLQANGAHTCGVTRGGEQLCWGYNVEGQLGDGTRNHRSVPVRVAGLGN